MQYPIFQSVVNKINTSLTKRNINVEKFKTWEESKINAAGLEIVIGLSDSTRYLKQLNINFDWDRFREAALASQLNGTDKHPMLKQKHLKSTKVTPVIDVELVWHFDEKSSQPANSNGDANYRIQMAGEWMDCVSRQVNEFLASDDIITRWHLEIDGDSDGKYLSAINLMSYFQFTMEDLKSLNEVHNYVERKLIRLLYKANRIIKIADKSVALIAA
jgi:hypothetical protein